MENDTLFCGKKSRHWRYQGSGERVDIAFFIASPKHPLVPFLCFFSSLHLQNKHLGFLNGTNDGDPSNHHMFCIEFHVFQNQAFNDINDNHVGVDTNSLISLVAYKAGNWLDDDRKSHHNRTNWTFKDDKLYSGAISFSLSNHFGVN